MYPIDLVAPMSQELNEVGFVSLTNETEVNEQLNKQGTTLLVINSVCGCAARNARPAAINSIQNELKPDNLVTVFAGVDKEAVNAAREFLLPYPPSSPAIALLKDGKLVHFLERHHIEGRTADVIADNLVDAFNKYCN
jgi:putative YphP/YqiW family bacilliredoxin